MIKRKPRKARKLTYYIEAKRGRFYIHYVQLAPVDTIFGIAWTREEAEKEIEEHKAGTHPTQYKGRSEEEE